VGDIGGRVGQLARAFGMSVIGYDPFVQTAPAFEMVSSLDKLLAASDFVSIHSPLTAETKGMIGTRELRLMRPTSILVNTSRGGIVDEMALAAALENKIIGGAALDVFSTEPPAAASPLLKLPNLVMTPHVGGSTYEALDAVAAAAADTAIQYLSGGVVDPTLCINPIALQTKS
jgi:D-3-phosphoglycerate dehydrogenase